jgi:hypothetical protein
LIGGGQALATVVLNDYLNEKNINHLNVDKIILIEPSELTLKRHCTPNSQVLLIILKLYAKDSTI